MTVFLYFTIFAIPQEALLLSLIHLWEGFILVYHCRHLPNDHFPVRIAFADEKTSLKTLESSKTVEIYPNLINPLLIRNYGDP